MFRNALNVEVKTVIRVAIIVLIVIFAIIIYIIQSGTNQFNILKKEGDDFIEAEKIKALFQNNFIMYGAYGVQLYLMPDTSFILFRSTSENKQTMAHMDSGARLTVFSNNKNTFNAEKMDFSDIIYYMSLLIFLYGISYKRDEYHRFLKVKFGELKAFFLIVMSKIFFILFLLVSIIMVVYVQYFVNSITVGNLFSYWICIYVGWIFFLSAGSLIGLLNSLNKYWKVVIAFLFCVTSLMIPLFINETADESTGNLVVETLNLKDLMSLEKRLEKHFGPNIGKKDNNMLEKAMEAIDIGQELEYKNMRKRDINASDNFDAEINKYHLFSSMFPTSFMKVVSREISSIGDNALLKFDKFAQQKKKEFVRYYIKKLKVFFKTGDSKIDGEIFPENNVFNSKRSLPNNYKLGLFLAIFYSLGFFCISYILFKKRKKIDNLKISLKTSELNCFLTKMQKVVDAILNAFKEKNCNINIDAKPISNQKIIYLPDIEHLPVGVEKFMNLPNGKNPQWKEWLTAAINEADIVITRWDLDSFSNDQLETIKEIIKGKVYLNIGFNVNTWLHKTKNRIYWKDDPDVNRLNPFSF